MAAAPPAHNPVLTENGEVRASKVIGSTVYNDQNQSIGTVDDILLTKDHKADKVILSVGGFLGIGNKLVAENYDRLQFNEKLEGNTARVIMPGASKDALKNMQEFRYVSSD